MKHGKQKKMIHSALAIYSQISASQICKHDAGTDLHNSNGFCKCKQKIQFLPADNTLSMKRGTAWVTQHPAVYAEFH